MDKLFFAKTNGNSIIPTKRVEDAGYDFYCNFEQESLVINPGDIILIPSGIATAFPDNYVLMIKERGSTGSLGLSVRMGIIDSGYRAEIFIGINNTSNKIQEITKSSNSVVVTEDRVIYPYKKAIAQGLLLKLPKLYSEEISYDDLKSLKSQRMFQRLGESNK